MEENSQKNPDKSTKSQDEKNSQNLAQVYRKIAPYLNIGYIWAASVIGFTLLGMYLDQKWNTKPWLTLVGAIVGIIGGFYHFIKTVLQENHHK